MNEWMIELEGVSYTYPGAAAPALQEVILRVPAGQFCGIAGANGAGKSTLALTIAGYVPNFYHGSLLGRVSVAGKNTLTTPLSELVSAVGLVFQNPYNQISGAKFTVREEIAFGMENLGFPREDMLDRCDEMMSLVGIRDLAERSPMNLSGGQMQRVVLAAVLAMKPRVLVLDEPTSQLDPIGSREMLAAVRTLAEDHHMTVVMVEHKLEWLAVYADRLVALAGGRIIADGPPGDVLADEMVRSRDVGQTRYTRAADLARAAGKWPAGRRLAVTLDEAVDGFNGYTN